MPSRSFKPRAFTTLLVALGFAVLLVSGVVLFIAPSGRIARETGWQFLFINRDGWDTLHIAFALLFVLAGIAHIAWNWRSLQHHLVSRMRGHAGIAREFVGAMGVTLILIAMAVLALPPFSTIEGLHQYLRTEAWSDAPPKPSEGRRQQSKGTAGTQSLIAPATTGTDGADLYRRHCGTCHEEVELVDSISNGSFSDRDRLLAFLVGHGSAPSDEDDAIIRYLLERSD